MTSDDSKKTGIQRFRELGTGHAVGWTCPACCRRMLGSEGRKLRRYQGIKTWLCKECAK